MNRCQIIPGDCRQALKELPSGSVQTCVTSPPFWRLRSYLDNDDPLKPLEIGQERTPEDYVETMVRVFREVKRVLRDDGTMWLNLGSSYWGGNRGGNPEESEFRKQATNQGSLLEPPDWTPHPVFKPKDLVPIPWMVGMALQKDGWFLRSDIIWNKPGPMPESVTDRPTKAHEYIFLMSKRNSYFYDAEAIAEPSVTLRDRIRPNGLANDDNKENPLGFDNSCGANGTRNKRSVWTVSSQAYTGSHFAVFPEDLIKPCILAGTSAKGCCPKCGAPWERTTESETINGVHGGLRKRADAPGAELSPSSVFRTGAQTVVKTTGWEPSCECYPTNPKPCFEPLVLPCTVLDPFSGSGTTGQVALELGRKAILIELNPKYVTLIENRTHVTPGLPLA